MFASPAVPLHETLVSHVFGRFMPQRAQAGAADAVVSPAQAAVMAVAAVEDDSIPDLAQRVREVGEW